jgi:hypothetical protein
MSLPCILAVAAVVLLLPVIFILWATESTEQKVRRLRSYGYSQWRIAEQLQVSRYRVRLALA